MKKILILSSLIALFSAQAFAATNTATGSGNAKVKIISPITLSSITDINFGTIVNDGTTGQISMDTAGVVTVVSGAGTAYANSASNPSAKGQFTITAEPSATYTASFPASVIMNNGATNITTNLVYTPNAGTVGTMPAATTQVIGISGSFTIPVSAAKGQYTVALPITVTYN